jgi:8-oxo-dGTP diphosphatase
MKSVLVSAVAMIDTDGRVLLAQRPEGKSMAGMWEFPGGKVELDETPEACLIREIREELSVELCERCIAPLTFVSHTYENFHLLMMLYSCRKWEGMPQSLENQAFMWKFPHEMAALPMPPADVPLVATLRDFLS